MGRVLADTLGSSDRLPNRTNVAWLAGGAAAALAAHAAGNPLARRLPASERVDNIFGSGGVIGARRLIRIHRTSHVASQPIR